MTVAAAQRHTRAHRCPICDGADGDPRGKGKRCSGFTSADGEYVHCSREELAGANGANGAGLYAHRMHGLCRCGTSHGPELRDVTASSRIVATYDYTDEQGALLFQVVRRDPKDFRQRRPDGAGGWEWSTKGVRRTLYRLPELVGDDADRTVYVVEGEKDANAIAQLGYLATTSPGGAGKWGAVAEHAQEVLRGRDVIVIADADDVGRKHALEVADSLRDVARSVVAMQCPAPHKDASDLLAAGCKLAELEPLATKTEDEPPPANPWMGRVVSCAAEMFTQAPPRREWLLRDRRTQGAGVLPLGKVGMLVAEGGAGKTIALVQLALAVASHEPTPWLGCYDVPNQGRALLVLGEEDADEVHRRLYNARRSMGAPVPEPGAIVALPLAGVPCAMVESDQHRNPIDAPFLVWLRGYLQDHGPFALVIVDPLSRFGGVDAETDNAAATRFVQALESIAVETGATVIVAHHTNKLARGAGSKVDGSSARGSSAFYDGVRWAAGMTVERLETPEGTTAELVTLANTKSNYSRKGDPVTLERDEENGGALVPLSSTDRERIAEARKAADPRAKREAAKEEKAEAKVEAVVLAVRAALTSSPEGLSFRQLRAAVRTGVGSCTDGTLDVAIAAMADELSITEGARGASIHRLAEVAA